LSVTCAPLACSRVNATVRLIPVPETSAPAACARASGAATMIALPPNLRTEATIAVSAVALLPMVMVWPSRKPTAPATGMTVAPAAVLIATVVAPAVPTVAMTAVSRFAPVSIMIFWPASKPSTLSTLMLVAPATDAADRVAAAWVKKSLQLLSVSAPSGKRPALVSIAPPAPATLLFTGGGLISLCGPWVDYSAVIQAVDNQARRIAQHDVAFSVGHVESPESNVARGELRATEPLIWFRTLLVARRLNRGIPHHRVNRVTGG
jgi:hypothetical protein